MSHGMNKLWNEYAAVASADVDAPKAVWIALAYSFACRLVEGKEHPIDVIRGEWKALHDNGIVPQRPRVSR